MLLLELAVEAVSVLPPALLRRFEVLIRRLLLRHAEVEREKGTPELHHGAVHIVCPAAGRAIPTLTAATTSAASTATAAAAATATINTTTISATSTPSAKTCEPASYGSDVGSKAHPASFAACMLWACA